MAERRTMFQCEECHRWFFSMDVFVTHPCCIQTNTDSVEASTSTPSTSSTLGGPNTSSYGIDIRGQSEQEIVNLQAKQEEDLSWSRAATLLLLSEYKKRQSNIDCGKLKKKKAFEEISKEMQGKMYGYSGDQCHGRMKTLIRAYKQVKDHNSRSGNSHKTYQYEKELDELFGEKPNIVPKCTISSSGEKPTEEENTESDSDGAGAERTEKSQKRKAKETEEEGECKVCMEELCTTTFIRCGHMVCCPSCCEKLTQCPICREEIVDWIRVFKC